MTMPSTTRVLTAVNAATVNRSPHKHAYTVNILVCTDEPPFPPRNGVTIPACGYIRLLQEAGHNVDCLVLLEDDASATAYLTQTAANVRSLHVLRRRRQSKVARVSAEIFGKPAFAAWRYQEDDSLGVDFNKYAVILATPIGPRLRFSRRRIFLRPPR